MKGINSKIKYIVGIDEVGRGPLAGPVCLGALAVKKDEYQSVLKHFGDIRDSKQLTEADREVWFKKIRVAARENVVFYSLGYSSHRVIDRLGLAFAIRDSIRRALLKLSIAPAETLVLLDGGMKAPLHFIHQQTIIGGDENEPLIALASIVAKVSRDRLMRRLAEIFSEYGFEDHKGYGTADHLTSIEKFGLCPLHRRSFLRTLCD